MFWAVVALFLLLVAFITDRWTMHDEAIEDKRDHTLDGLFE